MNIGEVIKREFLILWKQPKLLLFIFGGPIGFTLLFGVLYVNNVVKHIPLVIFDNNQTQISRLLTNSFEDSEKYKLIAYVDSEEEMKKCLEERKALAALIIPQDFSNNIKKGLGSQALIMVDGTNMIYANSVTTSANEIIQTFSAGIERNYLEALGQMPETATSKAAPVQMRLRLLYNPTLNYSNFMLLGLILTVLQQSIILSSCLSMIQDRDKIEEWQNIQTPWLILGKAVPYTILGTLAFYIAFSFVHYIFLVPYKGNYLTLFWLALGFSFFVTQLGFIYSTVCPDELTATQYSMLYAMPSFLFSGYTWPVDSMNWAGQIVAALSPLKYVTINLRDLALSGYSPKVYSDLGTLVSAAIILFSLTAYITAKKKKKLIINKLEKSSC